MAFKEVKPEIDFYVIESVEFPGRYWDGQDYNEMEVALKFNDYSKEMVDELIWAADAEHCQVVPIFKKEEE